MVRKGFSFIELLVSIVVIGIVFMSVPLILVESEKSAAFSMQQEGIMAGMTTMVNILGHRWDEADTNKTLNGGFAKVCDVTGGSADLNRTVSTLTGQLTNRRIGHFKGEYRRKFYDYTYYRTTPTTGITFATAPASLGLESGETTPDDIDDFKGLAYNITGGGIRDYKYSYAIATDVYYIPDAFSYSSSPTMGTVSISRTPTNAMTNIKMVKVSLSGDEGNITLYGFSSNIGEYKILHQAF